MQLTTEPINQQHRFWQQINVLAKQAFPPEEYLSPQKLVQMAQSNNFDFLALTQNDNFVGFVVVQTNSKIAYLFFLAIAPEYRSKGYGSSAIQLLKTLYPNKQQVVDFEMTDETAPNNAQRIKRRQFYLRNGYKPTGLFLSYLGVDYEVMCMDDDFCLDDFKALMQTINVDGFNPKYFTK